MVLSSLHKYVNRLELFHGLVMGPMGLLFGEGGFQDSNHILLDDIVSQPQYSIIYQFLFFRVQKSKDTGCDYLYRCIYFSPVDQDT